MRPTIALLLSAVLSYVGVLAAPLVTNFALQKRVGPNDYIELPLPGDQEYADLAYWECLDRWFTVD